MTVALSMCRFISITLCLPCPRTPRPLYGGRDLSRIEDRRSFDGRFQVIKVYGFRVIIGDLVDTTRRLQEHCCILYRLGDTAAHPGRFELLRQRQEFLTFEGYRDRLWVGARLGGNRLDFGTVRSPGGLVLEIVEVCGINRLHKGNQ